MHFLHNANSKVVYTFTNKKINTGLIRWPTARLYFSFVLLFNSQTLKGNFSVKLRWSLRLKKNWIHKHWLLWIDETATQAPTDSSSNDISMLCLRRLVLDEKHSSKRVGPSAWWTGGTISAEHCHESIFVCGRAHNTRIWTPGSLKLHNKIRRIERRNVFANSFLRLDRR